MLVQAILFDRDNTLLRFNYAAVAHLEQRITQIAPTIPAGAAPAYWQRWPGPWPRHSAEEPAFWQAFWRGFATVHSLSEHAADALVEIGDFYHTCFLAFPDAIPCIQSLQARNLRLGVLTNFELPSIDRTLEYSGIDPNWFDVLLSSGATGFPKPDRRAYVLAAEALNVPIHECMLVDDIQENVIGARVAGMQAILLDRSARTVSPDAISSLDQLIPRLFEGSEQT